MASTINTINIGGVDKQLEDTTARNTIVSEASRLDQRIDEIITPGSAPSAAEVTDARIGADGVTYSTLGKAIRTQMANVTGLIDAINCTPVEITINRGYAMKTQTGQLTAGNNYYYSVYQLNGESEIGVMGYEFGGAYRTGCFRDANNNVVSEIALPSNCVDKICIVDVPANASNVVVNGHQDVIGRVYRVEQFKSGIERTNDRIDRDNEFLFSGDVINSSIAAKDFTDINYTSTGSEGVYGVKELLQPCYVESVTFKRKSQPTSASEKNIGVFFVDENYVLLHKVMYEGDDSLEVTVPINKFIDKPFYMLFRCIKIGYTGTLMSTAYRYPAFNGSWGSIGFVEIGQSMASLVRTETYFLVFNVKLNIKSMSKAAEIKQDDIFSVDQAPRMTQNPGVLSAALDGRIWGTSFVYPKGFIKSASFMIKTASDENCVIFITNKSFKILKKAYFEKKNMSGIITVPINYLATEEVYVFARVPSNYYDYSGDYFGIMPNNVALSWGGYGYKTEGDTLFDGTWATEHDKVLLCFRLNYDNTNPYKYQAKYYDRIYTLGDAYRAWVCGEKFPICVIGDSTTDGDTTGGNTPNVIGTDHTDPNTYTTKLQNYLREALNNSVLRIYNAGFTGKTSVWALKTMDEEIWNNPYYADSKIVVISHGINEMVFDLDNVKWYKDHLAQLVMECYEHGAQPVMMTHQAGMENYTRFGWKEMSMADKCTIEVAQKFNLEVIDKNKFTRLYNVYSQASINDIIPDSCHYGTLGHTFVAGSMFAQLVPTTIFAGEGTTILGFANEELKTELEFSSYSGYIWKDVKVITPSNGFKLEAQCSKSASTVLMDYWVFVCDKGTKTLTSYCTTPNVQTVILDGISHNITQSQQVIDTLDIGLHHIMVTTGASNSVNYLGLKLT